MILLLDAVRKDHFSCYGNARKTTPNIDQFANEGVTFDRAHACAPWTLASVASAFTGNMPETHGAGVWSDDRSSGTPTALDEKNVTFAERLKSAGYKSYCRSANPYLDLGCTQGFDKVETIPGNAEEVVDWGLESIKSAGDSPACLYLHFMDAHTTRDLPKQYVNKFETPGAGPRMPAHQGYDAYIENRFVGDELVKFSTHRLAVYDGAISYIDKAIGRLRKGLEARGRLDRTWFVILADHGEEFWDHLTEEEANYHDSRGYFGVGHGHTLFEELLQVPLVVAGPGVKAGARIKTPVSLIDLSPTLLDAVGMGPQVGGFTLGRSLLASFDGTEPERRPVYAQQSLYGHKRRAIIDTDDWKYIHSFDAREKDFLFDLKSDPLEKNNKLTAKPESAAELKLKMERFFDALPRAGSFDPSVIDLKTAEQLRNVGYLHSSGSRPAQPK
ncbi:MAG: sulfatase [Planctomycetes bacterium]|nr:sulfatase [Planctomycetota bacterium]